MKSRHLTTNEIIDIVEEVDMIMSKFNENVPKIKEARSLEELDIKLKEAFSFMKDLEDEESVIDKLLQEFEKMNYDIGD